MDDYSLVCAFMESSGLGRLVAEPVRVTGGYLHRMYRAETATGIYAVKLLNPEIMSRPDAMENYARAEAIEAILEEKGVPAVTSIAANGCKLQQKDGRYAYIFPWVHGKVLAPHEITTAHCKSAGALLAKLHSVSISAKSRSESGSIIDWDRLAEAIIHICPTLHVALSRNISLIKYAHSEYVRALSELPNITTITNGDMDCKNVMWQDDSPLMIDLECLDYGNPVSDMLVLAFSWAGGYNCSIDPEKLDAFIGAYAEVYPIPECNLTSLFSVGCSWFDWLEYNIRRASGIIPTAETGRQTALEEALLTIDRIVHHFEMHSAVLPILEKHSTGDTNS